MVRVKPKLSSSGSLGALVSLSQKIKKKAEQKERERVRVSNLVLINDSKSRYQFSLGIFFFCSLEINGACQGQKDQPSTGSALLTTTSSLFLPTSFCRFFFFFKITTTLKRSCMSRSRTSDILRHKQVSHLYLVKGIRK